MPHFTLKELVSYAEKQNIDQNSTDALESFYFCCKMKNLSQKTDVVYGERLFYLLRFCIDRNGQIERLTKADLQDYIKNMIDKVSPATVNGRIAVFKVFYNHLLAEGMISVTPMGDIRKIREPKTIKETLTPEDVAKVLSTFNRRTFIGSRNFCLILLSFDSMLRVSELLSIKTDQLDLKSGLLKVLGKGRKERIIGFSPQTARALFGYVGRYREKIRGELLFCTRAGKELEYGQTHRIFHNAGNKVGLHFYPHLSRASGATQFVRSNGNIAILQKILGHSSLAVTERYIHMTDSDILAAYQSHAPAGGIKI